LNAIEWCLFGKVAYFKSAESKADTEIVNVREAKREAKVKITLVSGSSQVEIVRTKRISNRETDLTVSIDGRNVEGTDVQETIFKLLGSLTFDDFYRSVYLHQESINALITDDPRKRDEAVDRLLGLETVRNIIGSIPMQDIKKSLEELIGQKEKIRTKLQGAIEQITADVAKAESDARKGAITNAQISMSEIENEFGELQSDLNEIATESQTEPLSLPSDLTTEIVTKLIPKTKTFLRNSRKKIIDVTGVDELRRKQGDVLQLKLDANKTIKNKIDKEAEIQTIVSTFGDVESIGHKINEANTRREQLNKERDELDAKAKLAKDALYFFEESLLSTCPVCGQTITHETTKKHLEEIVDNAKGKRVNEIDNDIVETNNLSRTLTAKKDELAGLRQDLAGLLSQISSLESKCLEYTETKVEIDGMVSFLDSYLGSLQERISESNNAFNIRNNHIEKAETKVDRIQLINNVLLKREDYGAVEKRSKEETEESKGLSQSILEIEKFKGNIEVLVQVLNEIQNSSAIQSISQARVRMASFYERLRAHPYYNQLDISVTSKNVQGIQKNTYLVKAKSAEEARDTYVSSRFSAGQLNCTALAIFLSLAEISSNKIGFIMLDDPSQSLDDEHVRGLSEVLSEFSTSKQVIISTQEDNLYKELKTAFNENGDLKEIKFRPWTKDGCQLESDSE
jgi:DNA repair exonuclease SbcCD ATPase subunit